MTGGYACFAPGAKVEIDLESILLARSGFRQRDAFPKKAGCFRKFVVLLCEEGYRRECLLFAYKSLDERSSLGVGIIECSLLHIGLHLKRELRLNVEPVRIRGSDGGERLLHVITPEEMPEAEFEHPLRRKGITHHDIDLGAHITVVRRIDPVVV